MGQSKPGKQESKNELLKTPTGVAGFDELTDGGLPRGRTTLICGGAGCGKTLFAMSFLLQGAERFKEPGVIISFEETAEELAQNVASMGFDLEALVSRKQILVDYVHIDPKEIYETGNYDLEGLFVRIGHAIDSIGARRIALDTIEALFAGFSDELTLRTELRRLFRWLKTKGITAVVTAERGSGTLTRHGLEEYVSDCVILLDHRVEMQISTRRLRVVKYRGSMHGTNEYPFLIDPDGISVSPITSLGLQHAVSSERISSGIPPMDEMLEGKGFYRGSSILVSGTSGTGKTSLAATFAEAACRRGENVLYLAMEESPGQIIRNVKSIGVDLAQWEKKGLLAFQASRPTAYELEMHLALIHKIIDNSSPKVVVFDPVTNLLAAGEQAEVKIMLMRLIDYLKSRQITALFTSLSDAADEEVSTVVGVSSLMDAWILLRMIESGGERNRGLYILKSRGMAHSNQIREFRMTHHGIELVDAYLGPSGVLTGAARLTQEAKEIADALAHQQDIERKRRDIERKRRTVEAQIAALRAAFESEEEELLRLSQQESERVATLGRDRKAMARARFAEQTTHLMEGEIDEIPNQKARSKKGRSQKK